jgi:hypothetical protein
MDKGREEGREGEWIEGERTRKGNHNDAKMAQPNLSILEGRKVKVKEGRKDGEGREEGEGRKEGEKEGEGRKAGPNTSSQVSSICGLHFLSHFHAIKISFVTRNVSPNKG